MSSGWSTAFVAFIWAAPIVTVVLLYLSPRARRALNNYVAAHTVGNNERGAELHRKLIELDERHHALSINKGALPEQIEAKKAQLRAEAAQSEVDAISAQNTVDAATQARERVIAARAQADVDLAQDFARSQWPTQDPGAGVEALGKAYKTYCESVHPTESPLPFGSWASGFKGLGV